MSGDIFQIRIISSKNCFLYMPEKWIRKIQETNKTKGAFVRIFYGKDSVAYLSCVPLTAKNTENNVAFLNASLARTLNVSDGDEVVISPLENVPSVSSVNITPISNDDFEILVESTGAVEDSLLDQVRVVWKGQVLPIWISKSFCLEVRVDRLEPNLNVGCLEEFTELIVSSPSSSRNEAQSYKDNHFNKTTTTSAEFTKPTVPSTEQLLSNLPKPIQLPNAKSSSENLFNKWLSSGKKIINAALNSDNNSAKSSTENNCQSREVFETGPSSFRVHPLDIEDADVLLPCHVVVHKDLFQQMTQSLSSNPVVCKIVRLIPPKVLVEYKSEEGSKVHVEETQSQKDQLTSEEKSRTLFAHLITADEIDNRFKTVTDEPKMDCVFLSNNIRRQLCLEVGARVKLFLNQENLLIKKLISIEITPLVKDSKDLEYAVNTSFKNLVHQSKHGLVLSSNCNFIVPNSPSLGSSQETVFSITLNSSDQGYAIIKREQLEACNVIINSGKKLENGIKTLPPLNHSFSKENSFSLGFVNTLLLEALHSINLTLDLHSEKTMCQKEKICVQDNVVILGKAGCGKTSFVKLLCSQLQNSPNFVWTKKIDCKPLKGKKTDVIIRNLKQVFDDAVYHQPSLIIMDDIQAIAGVEAEKDQHLMQDLTFKRVGRVIREISECLQSRHAIAIVATALSASQVNPELVSARGNHLFKTVLEIPELTRNDRKEFLLKALSCKEGVTLLEKLNLDNYASKTEGYTCQDLMDFIDKAVFVSWKMSKEITSFINEDVLTEAFTMSTPMSLRGVDFHQETRHGWKDIGGLTTVKEELLEILQWPSMYPELFEQCPLRLQSGVLLYGAPGTGKTLLAGAVAHECGINFISIKGPELLSKYIGASEESVRKVFEKAMSAKPCVLFFDEFDSLAPRRGHDSTGVTDRVVNQLLTQLDGVEGLNGVWVLAATSRPDLLDPALLRPGRLDRIIHCPLPDENDRLSIFQALSRHMKLNSDVDFEELAKNTNGFTGADLQAVLYTSQLAALEEREKELQATKDGDGGSEPTKAVPKEDSTLEITNSHILQSLSTTRPSLPPSEYGRYQRIYDRFAATRGIPTADMLKTQQKATLA